MQRKAKSWKTLVGLLAVAPLTLAVGTAQAHDAAKGAKGAHVTKAKHVHGKSDTHKKAGKSGMKMSGKSGSKGMSGMKMSGKKM